jgi:hypothetical protein
VYRFKVKSITYAKTRDVVSSVSLFIISKSEKCVQTFDCRNLKGRSNRRWDNNIKMHLSKQAAQDMDRWRTPAKKAMHTLVPQKSVKC